MFRFLRWSCRLATWMALVTGSAYATQAGMPSILGPSPYTTTETYVDDEGAAAAAAAEPSLDTGLDDCACYEECCECVCPKWAVAAGAILMTRTDPNDDPLYRDAIDPLFGSQFNQGWEGGFQVEVARRGINGGDEIAARFFWIDGWSANAVANVPGDTEIASNPPVTVIGPRHVASRMDSEINSFELNYYMQSEWMPAVRWIAGFRGIELDESIYTEMPYPGGGFPTVYHTVNARNRLYGGQLGAELRVLDYSHFRLKGFLLGGMYGNAAHNGSSAYDTFTAPIRVDDGGSVMSFVGETGLSGIYQMTEHWALRADYRVMAVSGVALATEQVAVSNFNTGLGYDTGGSVFYHGLFLGLDFAY